MLNWVKQVKLADLIAAMASGTPIAAGVEAALGVTTASVLSPVDLKYTPDGTLVAVSHNSGEVSAVPLGGGGAAVQLPATFVPTASISCSPNGFQLGYTLITCGATTSLAGREGGVFTWTVLFLSNCGAYGADTCGWTYLFASSIGGTLNFNAPWAAANGTLELQLAVNTVLGAQNNIAPTQAAPVYIGTAGFDACPCAGARTTAVLPPPPADLPTPQGMPPAVAVGDLYRPAHPLPSPPPPTLPWPPAPPPPRAAAVGMLTVSAAGGAAAAWGEAGGVVSFGAAWGGGALPSQVAGAQYGWRALLLTGCLEGAAACAYTNLADAVGAGGRFFSLTLPAMKLGPWEGGVLASGATLLLEANATSADGAAFAAGRLLVPAAGVAAACDCIAPGTLVRSAALAVTGTLAGTTPPLAGLVAAALFAQQPLPLPSQSPRGSVAGVGGGGGTAGQGDAVRGGLSGAGLYATCVAGALLGVGAVGGTIVARRRWRAAAAAARQPPPAAPQLVSSRKGHAAAAMQ